jgi:hypothetical protein
MKTRAFGTMLLFLGASRLLADPSAHSDNEPLPAGNLTLAQEAKHWLLNALTDQKQTPPLVTDEQRLQGLREMTTRELKKNDSSSIPTRLPSLTPRSVSAPQVRSLAQPVQPIAPILMPSLVGTAPGLPVVAHTSPLLPAILASEATKASSGEMRRFSPIPEIGQGTHETPKPFTQAQPIRPGVLPRPTPQSSVPAIAAPTTRSLISPRPVAVIREGDVPLSASMRRAAEISAVENPIQARKSTSLPPTPVRPIDVPKSPAPLKLPPTSKEKDDASLITLGNGP